MTPGSQMIDGQDFCNLHEGRTDCQCNILSPAAPGPKRILVKGATILNMDVHIGNIPKGDILIEGGKIVSVGEEISADQAQSSSRWKIIATPPTSPLRNTTGLAIFTWVPC